MSRPIGFIGIDQMGQYYILQKHPRKELLAQLGRSRASKMYADFKDGGVRHMGYVIAGRWISVYTVSAWKEGK